MAEIISESQAYLGDDPCSSSLLRSNLGCIEYSYACLPCVFTIHWMEPCPLLGSSLFTDPIPINESTRIRAIAYKNGLDWVNPQICMIITM
jgi:hypothetical protein